MESLRSKNTHGSVTRQKTVKESGKVSEAEKVREKIMNRPS